MGRKILLAILISSLVVSSSFAGTAELTASTTAEASKPNFLQEFDIVFWQTFPFAAFWSYAIAMQVAGGGALNWNNIAGVAAVVSAGNAYLHARKDTNENLSARNSAPR